MPIHLRPLSAEAFPTWVERSSAEYQADLVRLGTDVAEAKIQADGIIRGAFPNGEPTANNAVFLLVEGSGTDTNTETGTTVGYVWVGTDTSEDPRSWWVWDVLVEPEHRGKGYGKQAMSLAEAYAASQGAATLGLSVFGFNTSARGLYEALGYEVTSVKMRKVLNVD